VNQNFARVLQNYFGSFMLFFSANAFRAVLQALKRKLSPRASFESLLIAELLAATWLSTLQEHSGPERQGSQSLIELYTSVSVASVSPQGFHL
jgi:hypothetical protein